MTWNTRADGVLQKQANGLRLELCPVQRTLRIVVTDYHSLPVDITLGELEQLAGISPQQQAPADPPPAPQPRRVPPVFTRLAPLLLVGAAVLLADRCLRSGRKRFSING